MKPHRVIYQQLWRGCGKGSVYYDYLSFTGEEIVSPLNTGTRSKEVEELEQGLTSYLKWLPYNAKKPARSL